MSAHELEHKLLYSMVVAGKSAKFADAAMARFLGDPDGDWTPLMFVEYLVKRGTLRERLEEARTGNYTKLALAFEQAAAADIDLATCSPADLEAIHGIGPKTSRFFILWTRPDARCAALDTHVLKFLQMHRQTNVTATPSDRKTYARLEALVLTHAARLGMTPRGLDSAIWDHCSKTPSRNGDHLDKNWWPHVLQ